MTAGLRLCGREILGYFPGSINSMATAWNYSREMASKTWPQTIIDVGANVSQMTKLLSKCSPAPPTVLSFEPNSALQPIGRIFRTALTDKDGVIPLYIPKDSGAASLHSANCEASTPVEVQGHRFDSLVQNGSVSFDDLPKPILIKLDCEGSEFSALQGFGSILNQIQYVLVELQNRWENMEESDLIKINLLLAKHGFQKSKILYSAHDGYKAPVYSDVLFWKTAPCSQQL